jgi:hypothetical protein
MIACAHVVVVDRTRWSGVGTLGEGCGVERNWST